MIKSELSLEVSDGSNLKVMRIFDTSNYCEDETVENYLLEVLPVNKSLWIPFHVHKNFSLAFNSSNLKYKTAKAAADLVDLADGIYEFRQSFKPNIHTLVHFYHLRIAAQLKRLKFHRNKLFSDVCKLTKHEFVDNRDKLRDIEEYLQAAKYKVEECHDKIKGKELYEFSKKLLEQYSNGCKC